jgi:hypothetical protein
MSSRCDPDGQAKRRRAVLDHVAGAARTYYLLAELANASGARRAAQNFVTSAIRMTICFRKVKAGDLGLTAALARAIDELPDRALPGKSDNAHLLRSC